MRVAKTHAVVAAVAFAIGATASASAVTLITGKQIKNGSVGLKDLSKQVRAKLRVKVGPPGPKGDQGPPGDPVSREGLLPTAGGTLTGPLLAPAGAAVAPSYAFSSDPDSGIHSVSPGTVALAANGVTRAIASTDGLRVPQGFIQVPTVGMAPAAPACNETRAGSIVVYGNGGGSAQLYVCDNATGTGNPGWIVK